MKDGPIFHVKCDMMISFRNSEKGSRAAASHVKSVALLLGAKKHWRGPPERECA